jgi:hypothetical protein
MLQASEGKENANQVDGVERRVISVSDTKKMVYMKEIRMKQGHILNDMKKKNKKLWLENSR